jgi:hypothetical protein
MKRFINFILAGFLSLSSLLLMPIPIAHAAAHDCTWTGAVNTNWSTVGNWSGCGGIAPIVIDSVIFDNTSANITSNNNIGGLTLVNVSFIGSSTTHTTSITGNIFGIDKNLNIDVSNVTIANPITFNNLISGTGIKVDTAGLTNIEISGNIALASAIGQNMNINLKSDVYHGGAMTGTTNRLDVGSLGSAYNGHWQTSDSVASNFTSSSGYIELFQGTYTCQHTGCFGASANLVTIPANAGTNGQIEFNQVGVTGIDVDNVLSIDGSANQIIQHAGTTTLNNDVYFNQANLAAHIDIVLDGTISKHGNIVSNFLWDMQNGTTIDIAGSGALSSKVELNGAATGSGGMTVDHSELYLNPIGANTYTGVTTARANGGIIKISKATSLGDVSGGTVVESGVSSGGQLQLLAGADTTFAAEPLTVSGAGPDGTESAIYAADNFSYTLPGHITLDGNSTFGGDISSTINMTGAVSGTGDLTLEGADNSSYFQFFSATTANTYSGTTTVINGYLGAGNNSVIAIPHDLVITASTDDATVILGMPNQISTDSQVTMNSTGGFTPLMYVANDNQIKALNGPANGQLGIDPGKTLTIASTTTPSVFAGNLFGTGSLVQSSGPNAPLTLSGTSDLNARNITSNAGVLVINGDYTYSTIAINTGATLKGTGTVGNTTVAAGGTLSIGNSPGCMSIAGLLTLTAASTYTQEIASATPCSGYDVATVAGSATLGNATLNIVPSYTPNVGQVFTILTSEFIVGTYNGLPDNSLITVSGLTFRINYTATTVTLTFVSGTLNPTPLAPTGQNSNQTALLAFAVLAMALAGLGLEYGTRRRKHNVKV